MMDEPQGPETQAPLEPVTPLESLPLPPAPERNPFWNYGDLLVFAGLALPCMLVGSAAV
jgi:hypothetical protein